MPNSAGQFPVPRGTRVKGRRLCYTGLGRMVHVLDGSVGCGNRPDEGREATLEPKGSGGREDVLWFHCWWQWPPIQGRRRSDRMRWIYPDVCAVWGHRGPGHSDGHTQAFSLGPSGGHTRTCPDRSHHVMDILRSGSWIGACRVVRIFIPKVSASQRSTQDVWERLHPRGWSLSSVPDEGRTKSETYMAWSPWLHKACYGNPLVCTVTLFFNRGFVCLWVAFLAVVLLSFAFALVVLSFVSAVLYWAKFWCCSPFPVCT